MKSQFKWEHPSKYNYFLTTESGAELEVYNIYEGYWKWVVTNSHRPDKEGRADTVGYAKLAAETYHLRGVTLTDNHH